MRGVPPGMAPRMLPPGPPRGRPPGIPPIPPMGVPPAMRAVPPPVRMPPGPPGNFSHAFLSMKYIIFVPYVGSTATKIRLVICVLLLC